MILPKPASKQPNHFRKATRIDFAEEVNH